MPIMFPTNNPITFLEIVLMRFEIARPEFKLNSYAFFSAANFLISNAIRKSSMDFFHMHLKFSRDVSKQIDNAKFIFRRVMQWRI